MKALFDLRTIISALLAAVVVFALSIAGATAAGMISGKQIRNHTIGVVKLKRTAVASLRGQRGLQGPQGPAGPQGPPGPAGTPGTSQPSTSAYARVARDGTVMADFSRNIKQANVVHTGVGQYCFRGLPLSIKTAVASPSNGIAIGAVVSPPTANCSFVVMTFYARGKRVNSPFYVQFA